MRRAIWMALAFMGTAPLVALAQQSGGGQATQQPAASPSGASSIERGQDITGVDTPGAPGQQSAGSIGTATGAPATGGAGMPGDGGTGGAGVTGGQTGQGLNGVPLQRPGQGGQELTGGTTGTGGTGGTTGPTYRGTTQEIPSTAGAGAGTGGIGQGSGPGGGQAAGQQALMSSDAMVRELATLRERVARLERQVSDLGRGTGGGGTGGTGAEATANVRAQGPVTVATAVFDGRVVDVQPKHIDLVDVSDGTFYRLTIDGQTRAFAGPELDRIPVARLSEGSRVRTSFALISGEEHARNIVTQPVQQPGTPQGQPGTPQGQTPSQ